MKKIALFTLITFTLFAKPVHILMPVYNCKNYLAESLSSVQKQTYSEKLLIAYDDGSTDRSKKMFKGYEGNLYLWRAFKNKGIAHARKTLLEISMDIDPDAYILWLDADDKFTDTQFLAKFVKKMEDSGADICLFNYSIELEDPSQAANLNGLLQEKAGHEEVLDTLHAHSLPPKEIERLENVTSLGWTKGYNCIHWPKPLDCPYEDFVYMAALFNAKKITAFPSEYKPISYLRRSTSLTGKRTAATFTHVLSQLEQFINEIDPANRVENEAQIFAFLQRKITQYEKLLEGLVESPGHPDINAQTLDDYRAQSRSILEFAKISS